MSRAFFACLLLPLTILVLAPAARATQCRERTLQQKLRSADVVFLGRALAWDAELATTFEVERVFKGNLPARVVATTQRNKYASMAPPDRFVVYANLVDSAKGSGPKELLVHACGGTHRIVKDAPNDLAALGAGRPPAKAGSAPVAEAGPSAETPPPVEAPIDAGTGEATDDASPPSVAPASAQAPVPGPAPAPAPAPPGGGCAGCTLGATEPGDLGLGVTAFLAGVLGRRRRRRVSSLGTSSSRRG